MYFPVSGSLLFLLKPDPLKWIPEHQERTKNLQKKKTEKIFGGNNETAEKLSKIKTITNFTLVATIKKEKKKHKKPNFLYKDILHL